MPKSLFTIFELQKARILAKLYPRDENPSHAPGPRRPDLQETEASALKKLTDAGD